MIRKRGNRFFKVMYKQESAIMFRVSANPNMI
jgi:hypothetical protein